MDLRKINNLMQMITTVLTTQSALCQTQHNTRQRSLFSAKSIDPRRTFVCRWWTKVKWEFWHLFASRNFAYKRLAQDLADLCPNFQATFASTWNQLLKLTNVHKTGTIIGLKPTGPWMLPGTIGQSSRAFAKQD